ncbi:hypothetical protein QQF64_014618 [Cirrhinus molitorella]|uniref:Uncharacterized protein n=1 Tax=Cirrhinus molitorella TaxID=172907 RepID=A0ABR3NSM4_9TELE
MNPPLGMVQMVCAPRACPLTSSQHPRLRSTPARGPRLNPHPKPPTPDTTHPHLCLRFVCFVCSSFSRSVSVSGLSLPHCVEMSHTTDPVGHWEDLEAWLSAMTDSLLPKAAETLRHQTQDQLDDNLTSIMKQDPCQSYSHKELAKISSSLSHTLIATLKLSDRHAANLQKELTRAQQRIKQLELEAQERQKGSDETDASAKEEIARLQEVLTTTTQEREHAQSAYAELASKLQTRRDLTSPLPSRIGSPVLERAREQKGEGAKLKPSPALSEETYLTIKPREISQASHRPSCGIDFRDLTKLARNINQFIPSMPGGQDIQAYLQDVDFHLEMRPSVTDTDRPIQTHH